MSPRSRHAANPIQPPTVVLDGSGSPFGRWWKPGPSLGEYGGNDASALHTQRQLTISASIIGSVLPVFYGAREMLAAGQWWGWYRTSDTSWNGFAIFALSEGELGSISDIQLNDVDIADLIGGYTTPEKYVILYESEVGSDTQAAPSFLTGTGGIPGYVEDQPGLAYVAVALNTTDDSPIPSSIRLTAKVTGRKISDFRTGGAAAATSNPVAIAYDLLTNTEFGLGVSASLIDTGTGSSWNDAADHCDTVMSDSTKRYEWNGPIYERDLFAAIQTVLGHALMEMQYDTESGKYIIATSESGLSSAATISEDDWRTQPKWREIPLAERPNHITAYYTRADTFDRASVTVEDPSGVTGADMRRIEINLPGCYNASIATRIAVKKYNHAATEKFRWFGRLGPVIADVLPGQIVTLNTRTLSSQLARLVTKQLVQGSLDTWECEFVEYDSATDSTAVATDDTPISIVVDPPDAPTAATQNFIFAGDWDTDNLSPDPDNWNHLGWYHVQISASYNATNEESTLDMDAGYTSATSYYDFQPGTNVYVFGCFFFKITEAFTSIEVVYEIDSIDQWVYTIDGSVDTLYRPFIFRVEPSAGTTHRIALRYVSPVGGQGVMLAKRFFLLPYNLRPGQTISQAWSWTEHVDAGTTVEKYQLLDLDTFLVLDEVPVGTPDLERRMVVVGGPAVPGMFTGRVIDWGMRAVGPGGPPADFPSATQTFEEIRFGGTIGEQDDANFSSLADEDIMIYDSATSKWLNSSLAELVSGGAIDADDIDTASTFTGFLWSVDGGTVDDALAVIDGWESGGLFFGNDVWLHWKNKADTASLNGIKVNEDDLLEFGLSAVLPNAKYLLGRNAADTANAYMLGLDGSDVVRVGSGSYGLSVLGGGTIDIGGITGVDIDPGTGEVHIVGGSLKLDNAESIQMKDSGGTARPMLYVNASDLQVLGNSNLGAFYIYSNGFINASNTSGLIIGNSNAIQGEINAGGAAYNMLYLNISDDVVLGNANSTIELVSDGTIDANAADITDVGSLDADDADIPRLEASHSITSLSSGVSTEYMRFYMGTQPDASGIMVFYEVVVDDGTDIQVESGIAVHTICETSGATRAGSATKVGSDSQASSGTLTVTFSTGNAGVDHGRARIQVTTSLSSPSIRFNVMAIGAGSQAVTWSL